MTLARKIIYQLSLLGAVLLLAAGGMLWGVCALQRLSATTHEEFDELRQARVCEGHVAQALEHLVRGEPSSGVSEIDAALETLNGFVEYQDTTESNLDEEHDSLERRLAAKTNAALRSAREDLVGGERSPANSAAIATLRETSGILRQLTDEIEKTVAGVHDQVAVRFRATLWALIALFAVMLTASIVFGVLHYRSIIRPLRRLREGARDLAAGKLSTSIELDGDAEFVDLQGGFNHMSRELASLYDKLEERVAQQSKQLARSERLASVGYLAAGVAHEINNPLAIISGYTESVLRKLRAESSGDESCRQLFADLEIVRDEAFRCKRITDGLLDLSRMGDQHRSPVSMKQVVEDVVGLARSAPLSRDRTLSISANAEDPLCVSGSAPELKQVVLNLTINALRAVPPETGRVELTAARRNGWVELHVGDNGCGMTAETLAHVFEPFYTRSGKPQGVGLGLTISQTIAERHGGTLLAESAGPGRGSTLTLRIPACTEPDA